MTNLPFHISIRPFHIKRQGICGLRIQNHHVAANTFTVSGQAEDKQIQFSAMPAIVTIPHGQKGAVCVRVRRKRPFLGLPRQTSFTIQVKTADGFIQTVPGQLAYTPLIALWQLAILSLLVIGIFLV